MAAMYPRGGMKMIQFWIHVTGLEALGLERASASILVFKDTTPIVESCSCYTCQNHTKAYINHLLNVHKMLAQILLKIYKPLLVVLFIREAIKTGKFELFEKKFIQSWRDHLPVAVAE